MKVLWTGSAPGGNYTEVVNKAGKELVEAGFVGVIDVEIAHDEACALLNGGLPCNCSPDITLYELTGEKP